MGNCWNGIKGPAPHPHKEGRQKRAHKEVKAGRQNAEGYKGPRTSTEVDYGSEVGALILETWPGYRIGGSVWPSGMLLAHAFASGVAGLPDLRGRSVAELGAGPGVPSLVSARLGAADVIATDRADLVPLLERNIELNSLEGNCRADVLDWADAALSPFSVKCRRQAGHPPLDVILAADVVYFEEQDPLIDALEVLMEPGHTVLVLAYRQRTTADRVYLEETILPHMDIIRIDYSHDEHDVCEIYVGKRKAVRKEL